MQRLVRLRGVISARLQPRSGRIVRHLGVATVVVLASAAAQAQGDLLADETLVQAGELSFWSGTSDNAQVYESNTGVFNAAYDRSFGYASDGPTPHATASVTSSVIHRSTVRTRAEAEFFASPEGTGVGNPELMVSSWVGIDDAFRVESATLPVGTMVSVTFSAQLSGVLELRLNGAPVDEVEAVSGFALYAHATERRAASEGREWEGVLFSVDGELEQPWGFETYIDDVDGEPIADESAQTTHDEESDIHRTVFTAIYSKTIDVAVGSEVWIDFAFDSYVQVGGAHPVAALSDFGDTLVLEATAGDGASLTRVPEPASIMLIAMSLAAVAARPRRSG